MHMLGYTNSIQLCLVCSISIDFGQMIDLQAVLEMCIECTGCSPTIQVEAFSSCGGGLDDDETPKFPYMPHVLKYIVMELLKNSCRATTDMLHAHPGMRAEDCPINVIVCADEDHVTICVADRARGGLRQMVGAFTSNSDFGNFARFQNGPNSFLEEIQC